MTDIDGAEKVTKKATRKKAVKEDTDLIECFVVKGIAAGRPGDIVMIERKDARVLQANNAIKVVI